MSSQLLLKIEEDNTSSDIEESESEPDEDVEILSSFVTCGVSRSDKTPQDRFTPLLSLGEDIPRASYMFYSSLLDLVCGADNCNITSINESNRHCTMQVDSSLQADLDQFVGELVAARERERERQRNSRSISETLPRCSARALVKRWDAKVCGMEVEGAKGSGPRCRAKVTSWKSAVWQERILAWNQEDRYRMVPCPLKQEETPEEGAEKKV
ncbi:hypothetical protein KIPB_001449 [Kipferlia bialata]|uniref:Uncharacterized protein n=1 Tax=Kipferlia bialata TaxID=797122 RepID=A0A9K3GFY6_9EUKA|nr:hypothetical protein KIPB_001449 [Kipferlia bialata]|eukprot:g1449.t1